MSKSPEQHLDENGIVVPLDACKHQQLKVFNGNDFLAHEFPPRALMLGRWAPEKGLLMVHSWRGTGKTLFCLSVAYAVATGGRFANWDAPKARRVIYLDGEMPARVMQERLRAIAGKTDLANLHIISDDTQDDGLPDLTTEKGQAIVNSLIEPGALVVLDNISCLFRDGDENDARSWIAAANWLRALRRRNVTVLLIHHSGKGGAQRGTSKREDLLDTVIHLRRPKDYEAAQGARFEVHFEKARSCYGDDVKPVELRYGISSDGAACWDISEVQTDDETVALLREGKSIRTTASELGLNKSKVERIRKKALENGSL